MDKVSDFKLAESIIRKLCRQNKVAFVDVPLSFDEGISNALCIGKTRNVAHTTFKVIAEYVNRSSEITGVQFLPDERQRDEFFIMTASNLRGLIYNEEISYDISDDPHVLRLYQYPLIWILMKDIICPIFNKELHNVKIINAGTPQIDVARYYKKEEIQSEDISDEDFIFVNIVDNRIVQKSFLFVEALKAHDLSPIEVVKTIYDADVYDKYKGLLEIALESREDVIDFESTVMAILSINCYGLMVNKLSKFDPIMKKMGQASVPGGYGDSQFWYFGVLEKMIEPTRGSDWTTYQNLHPYIEEFWNKVEEVKKKRVQSGHDPGVPFDALLRLKTPQTVEYKADPTYTLQALLSSNRVW